MKTFAKTVNIVTMLVILLAYLVATPILYPIFVYMFAQDWRGVWRPIYHASGHWWAIISEDVVALGTTEPAFFKHTMKGE